jgi:hypothetical protein
MGDATVEVHDASGALLWKVALGTSKLCSPEIDMGASGDVFVVLGCEIAPAQVLLDAGGPAVGHAPLVKLASDGSLDWAVPLLTEEGEPSASSAVAVDGEGHLWVATTALEADTSTTNMATSPVLVLERRDASDGHTLLHDTIAFLRPISPTFPGTAVRLAGHPDGGVVLAGAASGSLDLDGVTPTPVLAGQPSLQVVRFAPDGTRLWTTILPTDRYPETTVGDLAVDRQGNVVLADVFEGLLQVGDTLLGSHGRIDAFVAKLGPDGTPQWARSIGAAGNDWAYAVGIDEGAGAVRLHTEALDIALPDGGRLESDGASAVLMFSPDGVLRGARCIPSGGVNVVAFDGSGGAFVVQSKTANSVTMTRLLRLPPF